MFNVKYSYHLIVINFMFDVKYRLQFESHTSPRFKSSDFNSALWANLGTKLDHFNYNWKVIYVMLDPVDGFQSL